LPELKAVIIDMSSVNNVDITSVQNLIDVRNQLDRYTTPHRVDWHFACISNRWTKRALASAGFGYPAPPDAAGTFLRWKPIFSVAEIGGDTSVAADAQREIERRNTITDTEKGQTDADGIHRIDHPTNNNSNAGAQSLSSDEGGVEQAKRLAQAKASARGIVVHGLNRPLFHSDLTSALLSAITNVEKEEVHTESFLAGKQD
jgi:solute carrier family 26 (sodium-independent sulfate anion transporter), member 11